MASFLKQTRHVCFSSKQTCRLMQILLESSVCLYLCVSNSFSNLLVCPISSRIFRRIQDFPLVYFLPHKMENRESSPSENQAKCQRFSARRFSVDKKRPHTPHVGFGGGFARTSVETYAKRCLCTEQFFIASTSQEVPRRARV